MRTDYTSDVDHYGRLVMAICRWARQPEHRVAHWGVVKLRRRFEQLKEVMSWETATEGLEG